MRRPISKTALLLAAGLSVLWGILGGPVLVHFYNNDFLCYHIAGTLVREGRFANELSTDP
jgi:hypothetical protein